MPIEGRCTELEKVMLQKSVAARMRQVADAIETHRAVENREQVGAGETYRSELAALADRLVGGATEDEWVEAHAWVTETWERFNALRAEPKVLGGVPGPEQVLTPESVVVGPVVETPSV